VTEAIKGDSAPFAHVGSQVKFLTNRDGTVGATHMFQYEQMHHYVAFLENRLNRRIELPVTNVSPERSLVLSDDVESKLRRKWAAEFELWDSLA